MKSSQQELKEAILFIAKEYGIEDAYQELCKNLTLPELSKMIIIEMFEHVFDCHNTNDNLYESYMIILIYRQELKAKGFVTFKAII